MLDKCTSTIIRQVEELKNLVNEFANFARLPAARLVPSDLNEVVREAMFLFKEGHRDVEFRFVDMAIPLVDLDREQMKRAISNLLDNAVAAIEGKGRIEVSTRYDESFAIVRLEVADDGTGINPEVRDSIFEPYYSTKKDGTGLGLSHCERHRVGSPGLYSRAPQPTPWYAFHHGNTDDGPCGELRRAQTTSCRLAGGVTFPRP